jgi:hypothetical protein
MRNVFIPLVVLFVLATSVVLIIAGTRSGDYSVSRSTVIASAPEKITPFINDFHQWAVWSPWEHLDPNLQKTFSGATSGPGAMYAWRGNSKAGQGTMVLLSANPAQTKAAINFIKPFPSTMLSTFDYIPVAGGTRVTWTVSGKQMFLAKVMSVFISMDKLMGNDFEQGLSNLKGAAEK